MLLSKAEWQDQSHAACTKFVFYGRETSSAVVDGDVEHDSLNHIESHAIAIFWPFVAYHGRGLGFS